MCVCPSCGDDPKVMIRCFYCSSLIVHGRDYEMTHSGRLEMFVKNLIVIYPKKIIRDFVIKDNIIIRNSIYTSTPILCNQLRVNIVQHNLWVVI